MLSGARIMGFTATAQPGAARAFYEGVLGLKVVEDGPFALVFDLDGTMLRVQKVEAVAVAPYTALGWQVDDIRSVVRALTDAGVAFLRPGGPPQGDLGIWTTQEGASVAWFKDPDGNTLSLSQSA